MPGLDHVHLHRRQDGAFHAHAGSNPLGAVNSILKNPLGGDDSAVSVSIVYVTASPTFSGPVQYSTVGQDPATSSAKAQPTTTAAASSSAAASSTPASSAAQSSANSQSSASSAQATLSNSPATASPNAASSTTSASAVAADTGLSGGAKAGIAFGVILGIAALVGLAFFFWKRKQMQDKPQENEMSEKRNPFSDNAATSAPVNMSPPAAYQAPAQFPQRPAAPPMSSGPSAGMGMGMGAAAGAAAFGAGAMAASNRSPERPENPFGPQSELPPSAPGTSNGPLSNAPPAFNLNTAPTPAGLSNPSPLPEALRVSSAAVSDADKAALGGAIGAAGIAAAAAAAGRKSPGPGPSSPTGSTASGAAAAGAKSTVHRVQLDFKPSMDDELELKAGDLIRLLHEYDDGWALCTRMDQSKQGVAPRTCLSASPVKPRPNPGASAPGRPGPGPGPRMPMQRPESPSGFSPVGGAGRNLIPNNGRPRPGGPGPYPGSMGPPRSGSPALRGGPPPRGMSPGPGPNMRNGPPRNYSPAGMRNGPPRSGSPGPMGPMGPGGPMMPAAQRQRSNSSSMGPSPTGPSPMSAGSPVLGSTSTPASPKISRKPVGAEL